MARSQRIYIVVNQAASTAEDAIAATFTVKHELVSWLERNKEHDDAESFDVFCSGDGLFQEMGARRYEP